MPVDINELLRNYDSDDNKPQQSTAEKITSQDADSAGTRFAIRQLTSSDPEMEQMKNLDKLEKLVKSREIESGTGELDICDAAYQRKVCTMLVNSLNIKNVQKMAALSMRENMRRGMNKEMGSNKFNRTTNKNQQSTITIPTSLLRYVQQEIGSLSTRTTQNDIMTGFLYWYFGKPEDVSFSDDETTAKISEIMDNLDLNASPSKFNRLNYNASNSLLDKLDVLSEQLDVISSLMTASARDSLDAKSKMDKMYIAICYNILNMLAFAPPIMPGDTPADVDLLANGGVWDLMSGVDVAYDYFKTRNGREIYKSKIRKQVNTFNYSQNVTELNPLIAGDGSNPISSGNYNSNNSSDSGGGSYEYYEDDFIDDDEDYEDYDPYDDSDSSYYDVPEFETDDDMMTKLKNHKSSVNAGVISMFSDIPVADESSFSDYEKSESKEIEKATANTAANKLKNLANKG